MTRALALLALVVLAATAAADQPALAVGAAAPVTALVDQNGQSTRLADLLQRHEFVVVAFYVKAFTGG